MQAKQPSSVFLNCARNLAALTGFTSPGPDELHPEVLKEAVGIVAELLSIIFENFWRTGKVLEDWKRANVISPFCERKDRLFGQL